MRIVELPDDATPEQIAERKELLAEFHESYRLEMIEREEEEQAAPILKAVRVSKARKQLKKVGIDHLVDL